MLGVLAVGVGGALVYVNRPVRRLVRFDAILERLPMSGRLKQIDEALVLYSRHPLQLLVAVLLSLGNHLFAVLGVIFLGLAFGVGLDEVGVLDYYVIVPVANIVSSLPLTPGGWGLGEAAYHQMFERIGANGDMGVAISFTFRLCTVVLGLLGGLFLLAPGARVDLKEIEAEAA